MGNDVRKGDNGPSGRQNNKGATTLVVDLAKVFEKVQLRVVWNWAR